MNPVVIKLTDALYPSALREVFKKDAPETITAIGNPDLLKENKLANVSSSIGSGKKSGTEAQSECNAIL